MCQQEKISNCLQNNGASNYDYDSVVKKVQELMLLIKVTK